MALPASGTLSLNEIHIEAGGTTATEASINDADIRDLIGKSSGTTMSFNEWYGASASLTLTAQSNATASGSSITTPSFAAGDIAIVSAYKVMSTANISAYLPTGFTQISNRASVRTRSTKAGTTTQYQNVRTGYKVLAAGDTSLASTNATGMSVSIYRPSTAITTVLVRDLSSAYSNTINCSDSSLSTIAFGVSLNRNSAAPTHTWGAGPTVNQVVGELRTGDYLQNPQASNVSWSTNSYTGNLSNSNGFDITVATSGYLEVS